MKVVRYIHVNVVCSDLTKSIDFYVNQLGGRVHEAFESGVSDLRPTMGVHDGGAPGYRAALVYFGEQKGGPYIDLLEWVGADLPKRRSPLAAQDLGLVRVALEVEDLDSWVKRLEATGTKFVGPIQDEWVGPWPIRLALCEDPDGTLIELVEFPQGQVRRDHDRAITV